MKINKILALIVLFSLTANAQNLKLLIGTYTNTCQNKGIYMYNCSANFDRIAFTTTTENIINPSYLSIADDKKNFYSVNENGDKSQISSYKYDAVSGKITFLNAQDAKGDNPCYLINDDKNVITANYSGGNIAVFNKKSDKTLSDAKQIITHSGNSINTDRQEAPHVHMVCFSPDKKYVLANDLGTDSIYVYDYNKNATKDILKLKQKIGVKPGSGPRHLVFSNNGKFAFVLNELTSTISSFEFKSGTLTFISDLATVTEDFKGALGSADIHISKDGKFLYASNRGDVNEITTCEIAENGSLKIIAQTNTLGRGPRNFVIDPTGNYLLVANQYSNTVVVFNRDKATGLLTDSGKRIEVCAPVCLKFL